MIKILFLCHGNICRSPMAEYMMKYLALKNGRANEFEISSAAVSTEEIGNDIYPPAKRKLTEKGIPYSRHHARQITAKDYEYYDYLICMDKSNLRWLQFVLPKGDKDNKVSLMMSWVGENDDVADPWYTGDFEETYECLDRSLRALLKKI